MKVQVVIGANYGDEGKGLVSGCLAREAYKRHEKILTVFYNGTSQRAHTFEDQVYRCVAAGTKYGSDTFYHERFVVDPISLLITQAAPIIDGNCRVILPCDVITNRNTEKDRGAARHGSCGFGLFEAVKRSKDPEYDVRINDLNNPWNLYNKLQKVQKKYGVFNDEIYNLHSFMLAVDYIQKHCKIHRLKDIAGLYDRIIFEGGQGLLLDQSNKNCFPHLTPSSTGSTFISKDITDLGATPELFYVSRSYETRHGAGPMDCECVREEINPDIVDNTNIKNEFQGSLRFGKLNTEKLYSRIKTDSLLYPERKVNIVFTQMNYTNNMLETDEGRSEIVVPEFIDTLYVSDQKDRMEIIK